MRSDIIPGGIFPDYALPEYTDPENNPMIPHTLVLKPGLVVHSIYNGYWDLSTPGLRRAWDAGDYSQFHGWDKKASEPAVSA